VHWHIANAVAAAGQGAVAGSRCQRLKYSCGVLLSSSVLGVLAAAVDDKGAVRSAQQQMHFASNLELQLQTQHCRVSSTATADGLVNSSSSSNNQQQQLQQQ
jgi:hypothetical protein